MPYDHHEAADLRNRDGSGVRALDQLPSRLLRSRLRCSGFDCIPVPADFGEQLVSGPRHLALDDGLPDISYENKGLEIFKKRSPSFCLSTPNATAAISRNMAAICGPPKLSSRR